MFSTIAFEQEYSGWKRKVRDDAKQHGKTWFSGMFLSFKFRVLHAMVVTMFVTTCFGNES